MRRAKSRGKRELVIREAIVQLFALQHGSGTSIEALRNFALECVDSATAKTTLDPKRSQIPDVQTIASLLRSWHRETKFLTKDGRPKPLSLGGRNGLYKLIERYFVTEDSQSVLESLKKSGLIRMEERQGRWIPTGKYGVVPIVSTELLAHLAEGVSRYVETVTRNVTTARKENTLFERSSKVKAFPVSAANEFRALVNQQAIAFLSVIDDWLEAKVEDSRRVRTKKCTAGAFAFAFLDDSALG